MFELTGVYKEEGKPEEIVESKAMTAESIAKYFGLPDIIFKKKNKSIQFEVGKQFQQHYPTLGQTSKARGVRIPTSFVAKHNGSSVEVRYFTSKRTERRGGIPEVVYSPKKLTSFSEPEISLFPESHMEEIVYYMLHPRCGSSPLHDGGIALYDVVIREYDAKKSLDRIENEFAVIGEILAETNWAKIQRKAMGVKVNNEMIQGVELMTPIEMKNALLLLAKKYPKEFPAVYADSHTNYKGLARAAVVHGICVIASVTGNKRVVKMASDYGGQQVGVIGKSSDPADAVYEAIISDQDFGTRIAKLVTNVSNKAAVKELDEDAIFGHEDVVKEKIKVKVVDVNIEDMDAAALKELDDEQLAKIARVERALFINEMDDRAVFLKEKGKMQKASIVNLKTSAVDAEIADVLKAKPNLRNIIIKELLLIAADRTSPVA